ncbi:hypothetical protein BJ138DRAFT_1195125 [Hygrophoropsis aurantiaca]|uniref:Uncharacterized protein n=1 Tax=Hygrophoropsis aurantiaca TaxID=72124 RepID=A0ACB7ZQD2_9AGAM|nr:hypothetical protein BJ138DRAFT_1195125 [Hygrophoropsis aurantiaca]
MYESEVIGCGRNVQHRPVPRTRAHAHETINTHYPRRADIAPRSVTLTGAQVRASPTLTSLDTFDNNVMGHVAEPRQLGSTSTGASLLTTNAPTSTATHHLLYSSSFSKWMPYSSSVNIPATSQYTPPTASVQAMPSESTIAPTSMLPSPQQTVSESHARPLTIIIAGSVVGSIALLVIVILTAFCVVRRRARRRYDATARVIQDNDPVSGNWNEILSSSSQADLGTCHEDGALVVAPDDHDSIGEMTSTAPTPPSTTATPPSTTPPTRPPTTPHSTSRPRSLPSIPVHTTPAHANSYPDPAQYLDPYPYLQRDPHHLHHSDCCSEHEPYTPCPAYSCISLNENNCTIGSASLRSVGSSSSRWHGREGREGRGAEGEGEGPSDGGEGRTRGGNRRRNRSIASAWRANIPPRSTTRASARTWMTTSDRSDATAPPSYDFANGPPPMHQ